jgi:hypothetical protein
MKSLNVTTLALGSQPRQRLAMGQAKRKPESHISCSRNVKECEGTNPHTPKGAPILGIGIPMDSQIFKERLQGSNPMDWGILYTIGKILELRCLEWARMTHLDIWNIMYGQKKGWESNCQFDSRPLKARNRPNFLMFRWCATYCWKDLDKGYNFASNLASIGGLHAKLWAPKVIGVPVVGISGLPLGSRRTKCHLNASPVASHRVYYKGEGGDFPQVWVVVSLVNPSLPVARPSIKSVSTIH